MPFMDGYEATGKIRQLFKDCKIARECQPKIVAVTGHVEQEFVEKAINSGMDKVFAKPVHFIEFGKLLLSMGLIQEMTSLNNLTWAK